MINTLIGQKLDQAQDFLQNGRRIPVTQIAVLNNVVLQVKNKVTDGYSSAQLGAGTKNKPNNALSGHSKKAGIKTAPLKIKEVRMEHIQEDEIPKIGESLSVDSVFQPGDLIEVTGVSKGKGFAGGVKRHGFKGGPKTHGQSDRHRAPGSIGQGTTPGRVYKGKRMAGRMGSDTVTVKNLTVVKVDEAAGMLYVSGLIPGHKNSWVSVTKIGEDKKFVSLLSVAQEEEAASTSNVADANAAEAITAEETASNVVVEESAKEEAVGEEVSASEGSEGEGVKENSETATEPVEQVQAEENVVDVKKEENA